MASFAHALRSFHSGVLSREELFAEVDRILENGRASASWLLETLDEENTKVPLPPDIHTAVVSRIEKVAEVKEEARLADSESGAGAEPFVDPDDSRTRLATRLFGNVPDAAAEDSANPAAPVSNESPPLSSNPQGEQMKGVGDVLNERFILEECIGTGGMSTVYKALDRRRLEANDRNPYVAVKVLNVEFRAHPDSLIALQREAKKSQSLAHPNIVRVYDFDRDGDTVYMTMEYLSGKSLAQVLRAPDFKGLAPQEAMRILDGVSRALVFAHDNGIVHADFKPANVILTDSGQVKVIDFGIARAFQRPGDTDLEVTRFDPGSLGALTPTYASPEMLELCKPDPRDDIYALACITYEMLAGRHPFGRMQATEARKGGLEPERSKNLTRRQWKALKSGLDFDREKRTQEVKLFVKDFCADQPAPRPVAVPMFAGVAALFAVVAIGLYYAQTRPGGSPVAKSPVDNMDLAGLDIETEKSPAVTPNTAGSKSVPESPSAPTPQAKKPVAGQVVAKVDPAKVKTKAAKSAKLTELSLTAVMPVIDRVPCAVLDVSVKQGSIRLRGYVSKQLEVQRLKKDLLALPGAKTVDTELTRVGTEKCEILDLYAPFWVNNQSTDGQQATIEIKGKASQLTEGDSLVVEITTPPYESYVNVDYYALDGGVVHMLPGPRARDNQAPANYAARIGDLGEWTIAEPFGSEMVAVLVTPQPLFKSLRKEYETKADYLAAVKKQLQRMAKKSGEDKIKADFVMINTKPKSK